MKSPISMEKERLVEGGWARMEFNTWKSVILMVLLGTFETV